MPVPTTRAGLLLVASSPLVLVSLPLVVLVDLGIIALCWWDARRTPEVSAGRTIRGSAQLMGRVSVRLDLEGRAGLEVRVTDDLGSGVRRLPAEGAASDAAGPETAGPGDASAPAGARVVLDSGGHAHARYVLLLEERGDRTLGDVHLRVKGLWGLAWKRRTLSRTDTIRVQPGMDELRKSRLSGLRDRLHRVGQRRIRRFGDGTEFESLREYNPGDDPRSIDWKASARRTRHLVRNYEAERSQTVVLAIDAGRLMREWFDDRERLDLALASALLLAERARAFGDRVGLIVFDQEVRLVLPPGPVRLARIADLLADVRSHPVEPNYPRAFAELRRTFHKRALVVLFSDVIDTHASTHLVRAMTSIARQHLPLMVALKNPFIERAAVDEVSDEMDAFRRGAAEELLHARGLALRTMRRGGVQVVDALPGALVGATLDRYVEIKERGLL